jgi:probable HAF family extracellular repeat protein
MRRLSKSILVALGLVMGLVPAAWAGSYSFVDIDYPLSGATTTLDDAIGLNNLGQIVGSYTLGGVQYAFIKNGGTYSTLSSIPGITKRAMGINDGGKVVGYYQLTGPFLNHGFIYDTKNDTLTTIEVPNAFATTVWGINDAGQISGYYYITKSSGFMHNVNSNSWTYLDKVGSTLTNAYGINDAGTIVGNYTMDGHDYGFTYYGGTLHDFNFPQAQNTRAVGINDHGDIVGRYWNDGGTIHGFVYHDGKFETLAMPGAEIVRVLGINNAGQIVGLYTKDGRTSYHGFLATPVRGISALFLLLND